jgi:CheW-like domain
MPPREPAAPVTSSGSPSSARRYAVVELGGVEYAVPAQQVRHSLPDQGEVGREIRFLEQVYPVVTLRRLFRLPGPEPSSRLIVLVETDRLRMALAVDRLVDVVLLDDAVVVPLPPVFAGEERRWFAGLARVGPRILALLRLEGLVTARAASVTAEPASVAGVR